MNSLSNTKFPEVWHPVGTTLIGRLELDSLLDTVEGFRIVVCTTDGHFGRHVLRAKVVYYQLHKATNQESSQIPSQELTTQCTLRSFKLDGVAAVHGAHYSKYAPGILSHFVLLLAQASRLDFIAQTPLTIRLAGAEDFSSV
ncbi:MAG: hypothetical protein IPG42_04865 [Betaproteobacteria bacterium]|nr:hypothetical protein [Betaproteobacteria bacterium]